MQNFHNFPGTMLQKGAKKNTTSRFFCTFYKYRDGTPSKKLWFALSTTTPKTHQKLHSTKNCTQWYTLVKASSLRPMSIVPFFKNAPLSRQFLHKLEVFCWKILVKAKKSAVPFLSNCCLKILFWAFFRFFNVFDVQN